MSPSPIKETLAPLQLGRPYDGWAGTCRAAAASTETMAWMNASQLPSDAFVAPGLTAGEWVSFLSRPETPAASHYEPAVVYGEAGRNGRPLTLFLYRRLDIRERQPGVLFVHGGGWHNLHPFLHIRHANQLAALGYVTATISYRLYPEGTIADAVADVKCAVRWFRANAARLGLDADRVAVAGGSAGGHLAAMAAVSPGLLEGDGGNDNESSSTQAAVLWYPITDLRVEGASWPRVAAEICENVGSCDGRELLRLSPVTYVSDRTPPILTMTGDVDPIVPLPMVSQFHSALNSYGIANDLQVFEGMTHAFDLVPGVWDTCFDQTVGFLERHLGC